MGLDLGSLQNDYKTLKSAEGTGGSFLENFVRMPEGKGSVVMRLLPPAPKGAFGRDDNPFYLVTALHRVNGKSLHDIRDYVGGKWVGKNPIVDYMRHLWRESEQAAPADAEQKRALYRQIKPIERYYYNVIVREERSEDGTVKKNVGPKILSVGKTVHEIILRGILGDKEMNQPQLGDVTDFKSGYDFKLVKTIRKSGEQSFPNYEGSHFLDQSPAGDPDECKKWMDNLHDLKALRTLKTSEELEHELLVHLGLKQDAGGFDPSKYASKPAAEQASSKPVTAAAAVKVESNSDDSDEDMADKDFLEELRRLG
ncbi:MAG: hypothetical protein EBZ48_11670 [Proteobacteria bacterium]|nr:hypothetical protein [Pseudomonadota bacterium]